MRACWGSGAGRSAESCAAAPFPLPARARRSEPYDPLAALDLRAYDLWALGAWLLAQGMMQRQKVCAMIGAYQAATSRRFSLSTR